MKYNDSRFIFYSVYPLTKKGEEEEEKGETYNPVDYHRVKKKVSTIFSVETKKTKKYHSFIS